MKKIIVIGRGNEADICIEDELVSRRHATLKILPFGKMEIRDLSKNGTYVNGIRLAVNKPYPVTRKDVVSFARVSQLDWNDVPDPTKPYKIGAWILLAVIAGFIAFGIITRIDWNTGSKNDIQEQYDDPISPRDEDVNKEESPSADSGEKAENGDNRSVDRSIPNLFPKSPKPKDKGKDKSKDESADKETDKEKSATPDKKEDDSQKSWLM